MTIQIPSPRAVTAPTRTRRGSQRASTSAAPRAHQEEHPLPSSPRPNCGVAKVFRQQSDASPRCHRHEYTESRDSRPPRFQASNHPVSHPRVEGHIEERTNGVQSRWPLAEILVIGTPYGDPPTVMTVVSHREPVGAEASHTTRISLAGVRRYQAVCTTATLAAGVPHPSTFGISGMGHSTRYEQMGMTTTRSTTFKHGPSCTATFGSQMAASQRRHGLPPVSRTHGYAA